MTEQSDTELLADGIYRDKEYGRWSRMALAGFAALAVFAAVALSTLVAALVLVAIAVLLMLVRASSARQRMIVRPEGLVVVRRVGSVAVPWPEVASAGAVPAAPPLSRVESVLAVRTAAGRELRIPALRDALDRETGVAPRVAELAAALVARAEWSQS